MRCKKVKKCNFSRIKKNRRKKNHDEKERENMHITLQEQKSIKKIKKKKKTWRFYTAGNKSKVGFLERGKIRVQE